MTRKSWNLWKQKVSFPARFHCLDSQSPFWVKLRTSLAETDYWRVLLCQRHSMSTTSLTLTLPVSLTQLTSPQTLTQQLLQLINLNQKGKRFVFVKASTHISTLSVYLMMIAVWYCVFHVVCHFEMKSSHFMHDHCLLSLLLLLF